MEEITLNSYLEQHPKPASSEAAQNGSKLWYNTYGDCIEYQTDQVAIIADRIDNYLTIYRSAENEDPVGFQLKDVQALMKKNNAHFGVVWETNGQRLVSVSSLLVTALIEDTVNIRKRRGYLQAVQNLAKDDEVCV